MRKTTIETEKLFDMVFYGLPHSLGRTPRGTRRFVQISGGSFNGPKLSGEILPVGADVALIRADGVFEPQVDMVLRCRDGAMIYVRYHGRFYASPAVMKKLLAREPSVRRGDFYLWNAVFFETSSKRYAWLNRILAVSTGTPLPITEMGIGMRYEVFQLL